MVSKPISVSSPAEEGQREAGTNRGKESSSRGHRKQLTVTMAGKKVECYIQHGYMKARQACVICAACSYNSDANLPLQGKRVVSEKPDKKPVSADIKGPTDDGPGRSVESPGRGKQPPHANKRDPLAQVWIRASEHSGHNHRPSTLTPPCFILLMFSKIDVRHVGWTRPSCDRAQKPSDSRWSRAVGLRQRPDNRAVCAP